MTKLAQRSFSGGEISPFVFPLTGIKRRIHGLAKAQNTIIKKFGTLENRTGLQRILTFDDEVRMVPFIDSSGEGFSVFFSNNRYSIYSGETETDDGTTQWPASLVRELNFSQQGDRLVVTHYDIRPHELVKAGTSWTLRELSFIPPVRAIVPGISGRVDGPGPRTLNFAVTAVLEDGRESQPSTVEQTANWIITVTDPIRITWSIDQGGTGVSAYRVYIRSGGNYFFLGETTGQAFSYIGEPPDTTRSPPGTATLFPSREREFAPVAQTIAGRTGTFLGIDTSSSEYLGNQQFYNAALSVRAANADAQAPLYTITLNGRVRTTVQAILNSRTFVFEDLFSREPIQYSVTGNNPMVTALSNANNPNISFFFAQRLLLASTREKPEDIFVSQLGQYDALWETITLNDRSPYSFALATSRFSTVKYLAGLREPIVFTGDSEWSLGNDLSALAVTPSPQSRYGIGDVPPEGTENSIIFLEGLNKLRDYGYSFQTGGYQGNDLTTFSSHLFEGRKVVSMAFEKDPDPIFWVVLDNGKVLSLTYFREQEIVAWCRHDFGDKVIQVSVLQKTGESEVYFQIERNGKFLIERLSRVDRTDNRTWTFLDSHMTFDGRNKNSDHTLKFTNGTTWDDRDNDLQVESTERLLERFYELGGVRFEITGLPAGNLYPIIAYGEVPESLRDVATTEWSKPSKHINLPHLVDGGPVAATAGGVLLGGGIPYSFIGVGDSRSLGGAFGTIIGDLANDGVVAIYTTTNVPANIAARFSITEGASYVRVAAGFVPSKIIIDGTTYNAGPIVNQAFCEILGFGGFLDLSRYEIDVIFEDGRRWSKGPGRQVAAYADGSVIANPYSGTGLVVAGDGRVDLGDYYAVGCVGIPYVSDMKTLPIDVRGQQTIIDQNVIVKKVILYLHNTRGLYCGAEEPEEPFSTEGLVPLKTELGRQVEIAPENGNVSKVVAGNWGPDGEVFVRQIDPLPLAIQSIVTTGNFAGFNPDGRIQ